MRTIKTAPVLLSVSLLMAACAKKEEAPAPAETPTAAPAETPAAAPAEQPTPAPAEAPTPAPAEAPPAASAEEPAAAPDDKFSETVAVFKNAGESAAFFDKSYGYAVFPTIGKGGVGIGGAHGKGRVYQSGKYVGDTTMNQLTAGFQLGAQAFSQIIFFEDKRSFDEFTCGNFEFSAQASAVAITAGASATAGGTGTSAGASAGKNDASTVGKYHKGMATFTVAKGGLMYEAALGGQKFKYTPKS
jgi:lipid-binding SYLF domain-containing protein